MSSLTHTVRYVSAAGDGESHWIRLDQEATDESVTVEEAAEFVDALYGIEPCETGTSGGGDAAVEDPPEEHFDRATGAFMGPAMCAESEYWTAYVRVYRSHQSPGYVLRSATATVESVEPGIRESVREIIETPGNSHDLGWPFAGDLVLPPGVRGEVRGSTLNLSRPVTGPLVVRYTTVYDRVTLHVPVSSDASAQGDEDQALRSALDAAGLVAFQGEGARAVAAATTLQPPVQDNTLSADELERLCRAAGLAHGEVGGNCWQTIEHYRKCQCSDTEAPGTWSEDVSAPCPQGVSGGAHLGTVRRMDGYVGCPGERDEELSSEEYYRRVCCHYPPPGKSLPVCRKLYSVWRGGEPIESGPDYWRDIYGPNVRLVAVTPPDGICGTLIHEWEVNERRCCDDVIPMTPHPDNPTTISPGGQYMIGVRDGRPGDFIWQLSGGLEFHDGTTYRAHGGAIVAVRARSAVCPNPRARVDDGCYPLDLVFEGDSENDFRLSAHDLEVGAGHTFVLTVSGGVPPYMWMATGDLYMIAISADGTAAQFRTRGRNEWCYGEVTVSDACGNDDRCGVRNALTGQWQYHSVPSASHPYYYNPPGAPYPVPSDFSPRSDAAAWGVTDPHGPYKVSYYSRLVQKRVDRPYEPERCEMFSAQAAMYQAMCAAAGWRMEDGVCRQGSTYVRLMTCYALSWYEWLCYE